MMTFSLGTGKVHSLAFSPLGDRLAVGIANRNVVLVGWPNTESRMELTRHPRVEASIKGIAFSPDGKELAGVYSQQDVAIWEVGYWAVPHKVWTEGARATEVIGVWYDTSRQNWVTCGRQRHATWSRWRLQTLSDRSPFARFPDRTQVERTWLLPGGDILTHIGDNFVRWEAPPLPQEPAPPALTFWQRIGARVLGVKFPTSPHESELRQAGVYPVRLARPTCAFGPDYRTVLTHTRDGFIIRVDVQTGEMLESWRFPLKVIYCLAVSPDGTVAAAGSNHGRVLVWDLA